MTPADVVRQLLARGRLVGVSELLAPPPCRCRCARCRLLPPPEVRRRRARIADELRNLR